MSTPEVTSHVISQTLTETELDEGTRATLLDEITGSQSGGRSIGTLEARRLVETLDEV